MAEVGALNIDLSLMYAKFRDGMREAGKALTNFEKTAKNTAKKLDSFGKSMNKIGGNLSRNLTLPIMAAGGAMVLAMKKTADYGDEIYNMHVRTGLSIKTLQELKYHAGQVGVEFDSIKDPILRLSKNIGDAASGSKEISGAFQKLGIDIKDANGNLKSSSELFPIIIGQLARVENETMRNSIAADLFGKGFGTIIPIIDEGAEGLKKYAAEAHAAGLVMSDEDIKAADDFGDAMEKLKQQFMIATAGIAQAFMPIIKDELIPFIQNSVIPAIKNFGQWLKNLSPEAKKTGLVLAGIAAALGPVILMFGSMASGLANMIRLIPVFISGIKGIGKSFATLTGPIGLAVAAIGLFTYALLSANPSFNVTSAAIKAQDIEVAKLKKDYDLLQKASTITADGQLLMARYTDEEVEAMNSAKNSLALARGKLKELEDQAIKAGFSLEDLRKEETNITGTTSDWNKELGDLKINLKEASDEFDKLKRKLPTAEKAGFITPEGKKKHEQVLEPIELPEEPELEILTKTPEELFNNWLEGIKLTKTQWDEAIDYMNSKAQEFAAVFGQIWGQIEGIINQAMVNEQIGIENSQKAEIRAINKTRISEEDKAKRIAEVNEKYERKMADFKTRAARSQKQAAIIQATIDTAVAAVAALKYDPTGILSGVVTALGLAQIAMIESQPIPEFAQGGLVYGDTIARMGEYANARTNPEVIAPLDKLQSMIAPEMEWRTMLRGEDIELILSRRNRYKKYQ